MEIIVEEAKLNHLRHISHKNYVQVRQKNFKNVTKQSKKL